MRATLSRRLDALESPAGIIGPDRIRLIVVRIVDPKAPDRLPDGIKAKPPWLPAVDRNPGESWDEFVDRLGAMLPPDRSPNAPVVVVTSR
jgi:hypothetical protein